MTESVVHKQRENSHSTGGTTTSRRDQVRSIRQVDVDAQHPPEYHVKRVEETPIAHPPIPMARERTASPPPC